MGCHMASLWTSRSYAVPMADSVVSVRDCELKDAGALARLTGQLGYASDEAQMHSRLSLILGRRDRGTFVAERSGRVVGYAGAWCGQGGVLRSLEK